MKTIIVKSDNGRDQFSARMLTDHGLNEHREFSSLGAVLDWAQWLATDLKIHIVVIAGSWPRKTFPSGTVFGHFHPETV